MLTINFTDRDFDLSDFDTPIWRKANSAVLNQYWSGADAPPTRHAAVRLLWSEEFFYVRFDAIQKEPLIILENPDTKKKTKGLWDRDVCEIFIAPDPKETEKYFEFEVAPTGEWLDLGIYQNKGRRETDWDYDSEMTTAARINDDIVMMAMKIPFTAFKNHPDVNDIWLGNLFRIVGKTETRGYLAWQPTKTVLPNFHVPKRFGEFKFVK